MSKAMGYWLAGGLLGATMALAGTPLAAAAHTTIHIDPHTGDVIDAPGIGPPQTGAQATPQGQPSRRIPDSAQGQTRNPNDPAKAAIVHCPDGSLRMGRAQATHGESARQALCAPHALPTPPASP